MNVAPTRGATLRINDQWRLIIEIVENSPKNIIRIVEIEDYH